MKIFNPKRPIKSIVAESFTNYIGCIRFLDSANGEVSKYNPRAKKEEKHKTKKIVLAENEELIGVYGVKDKQ